MDHSGSTRSGRPAPATTGASLPAPGVVLRHVVESDLAVFHVHQLDPEAAAMAAFPSRDLQSHLAHWRLILANRSIVARTVVVDGEVAGNVVAWEHDGLPEVGYWIGREHWGRGVATRALAAFLLEVRVRPVLAHVASHNTPSRRVLEKCGFVAVGETRHEDDGTTEVILRLDAP
jgi:RimJ/RimL family protein N-acetyltransferase